ncbi:MAG: hypothetical protein HY216_05295 [Candidatus Rokubacteria bacterium]|nr:hypothetical protein [Candidatus Rokubacteria bacterium]
MIPPVRVPLRSAFVSALHSAAAFGLVETLVAAALLGVALAAALNAFAVGAQALAFGERDTVAVFLAEDKLERIRAWARGTGAGQAAAAASRGPVGRMNAARSPAIRTSVGSRRSAPSDPRSRWSRSK